MNYKIIAIYCTCDDILKELGVKDDPQVKMTTAELMTLSIAAALLFFGNHERARLILGSQKYFRSILSKSQLNRRLHAIDRSVWEALLSCFSQRFKQLNEENEYIVDSFPISSCQNCRIPRTKLLKGKQYHGYCASKKSYFFGVKVHVVTTCKGCPVEVSITPGSVADITAFRNLALDLQKGSRIYGDKAYTDYSYEDHLLQDADIELVAQRKSNSKRPLIGPKKYLQASRRKRIETSFSQITRLFPRHINAVNRAGFELKIICFIIAFCFHLESKVAA